MNKKNISFLLAILFLIIIPFTISYEIANTQSRLEALLQIYSHMPLINVYYNRHFSHSKQFQDFKDVIAQVQLETSKYAKVIFTDCDKSPDNDYPDTCTAIKKTVDNRAIIGTFPANQFTNFGSKIIQSPPKTKGLSHYSDIYTQQQIVNFIHQLMPNFFRPINSIQQYNAFMNPKYVPKLLLFWNQQDINTIPPILKQMSVQYNLRFDFGFIQDLNDQIMKKVNIKKSPALVVVKFDFDKETYMVHQYTGKYSTNNYEDLDIFLHPLALKKPRNDLLFHKIQMVTENNIQTVQTSGQLYEAQERADGWIIIQINKESSPEKLKQFKNKYGDYFEYIHYMNAEIQQNSIQIYSPILRKTFKIENDITFLPLNYENFWKNATLWLNKDYVLLGVRQKYSHLCSLSQKTLFRGIVQCAIASQQDYPKIMETSGSQFEIGMVTYKQFSNRNRMIGNLISSADFAQAYKILQYNTRMKVKEIMDKMITQPIDEIEFMSNILDLCVFPTKKCALFVTDTSKTTNTKKDYLKQIALQLSNQYKFYEIDPACNTKFIQQISTLYANFDIKSDQLVVFHPHKQSWSIMKKKMSKTGMKKFLKDNLIQSQKLQLVKIKNRNIAVTRCNNKNQQQIQDQPQQL